MPAPTNEPFRKFSLLGTIVPIILIAAPLVDSWIKFISGTSFPSWQHYLSLISFFTVVILLFKNRSTGMIALGSYLILAIVTIFSFETGISYAGFGVGPLRIPIGNTRAWVILIVYFAMNMMALFDHYLAYKERKGTL